MEVSPSVFILKDDDDDDDDWVCLIKHFLEDFGDSHILGGNISTRHHRGHCQVKSCPASCGASLRLWSPRVLTSFPIFVKHWCKGLGPGAGGWRLKGFNLCTLTFSFSAFCWIDYVTT